MVGYSPWGCKELDVTEYACTARGKSVLGETEQPGLPFGVEGRCQVKGKELPGMGNQCLRHPGFHSAAPFLDLPM